jgi:hypothetical protein
MVAGSETINSCSPAAWELGFRPLVAKMIFERLIN